MKRLLLFLVCCPLLAGFAGCGGPLRTPMPVRLDDADQKAIDDAWNQALTPVDRYDRQNVLDILLGSQAYEFGVDRLTFRSEKKVSIGTVIMEIEFDRLTPEQDRFVVMVVGPKGKVLRREEYHRGEVEKVDRELFAECDELRQKKAQGAVTPEEAQRLAALEARRAVIETAFPRPKAKDADKNDPPRQ